MKKILLTGSAGFIGSNFMRYVMKEKTNYNWCSLDKVIAPYNRPNIKLNSDHPFYIGDICDDIFLENVFAIEKPDIVIHMAALSNVDASIINAFSFVQSNVIGTERLINLSLKYNVEKFVYISTDEVYGQLGANDLSWKEDSLTKPRNPYSASKLAGELMVCAANQTHNLNYNITRCCNNYGARQSPINLIPKIVTSLINNTPIPIHGNGTQIREWIYVKDHCTAIMKVVEQGKNQEVYNIGSGVEFTNLEMIENISKVMNLPPTIKFVQDRKGHDFRYSINCNKIKELGWCPEYSFEDGLKDCINWYEDNYHIYE